jgi:uncharacterized protein YhbP (UPF0306 family)
MATPKPQTHHARLASDNSEAHRAAYRQRVIDHAKGVQCRAADNHYGIRSELVPSSVLDAKAWTDGYRGLPL